MPFVIDIDPVAFALFGIPVRWYGLILVAAAAVAIWLAQREGCGKRCLVAFAGGADNVRVRVERVDTIPRTALGKAPLVRALTPAAFST